MANFVLVPGAWLGGWVWSRVIPLLENGGAKALPVTLTGMGDRVHLASKDVGMDTATQDVLNAISFNAFDDVVLVGHSFAGKVVAAVADRIPKNVRLVIYLDAFRPERLRTPQGSFNPALEFGPLPPGSLAVPFTEKIIETIGKDISGPDRALMLAKATPWPLRLAEDPIVLSEAFDSVESAYVFCTGGGDPVDEIIAGKWGRLEGSHRVIESGHWPMITKPAELAETLLALAATV